MTKLEHLLIEDAETLKIYLASYSDLKDTYEDTESTGLKWDSTLLGISLFQEGINPAFIASWTPYFNRGIPINELVPIMNDFHRKHRKIIMHNAKYDEGVFDANGFEIPNVIRDTMLNIHLADADLEKNLEKRVEIDLKYPKKKFKDCVDPVRAKLVKWHKGGNWPAEWIIHMEKVFELEVMAEYACEDVYYLKPIDDIYRQRVKEMKVAHIHDQIELPLTYVLKDMKKEGVEIDLDFMNSLAVPCEKELASLTKKIHNAAGCIFNINSGKQKAEVLYDKLGFVCHYRTQKGARATDKNALLDLKINQDSAVASLLLEYANLETLYNSFISAIPMLVDKDGRLRCDFNSEGARTGRFSSSNPNLQNQPNNKRFPVRAAFVPRKGYKFVILDWSQIELRVAAHMSKDKRLMQAFKDGRDIHQEVADQLGITRDDAKGINFGILYGLGVANLARHIEKPESYAKKMLHDYGVTYSGLIEWKKTIENGAKTKQFVRNMFGRVRPLRGAGSRDGKIFYKAMRQAVNTMIQGTCADLMKIGMLRITNYFKKHNIPAHLLLCVHDEVVLEVKNEYANEVFWKCKKMMETITPMDVPIIAEGKICDNWAQSKQKDFAGYQTHEGDDTLTLVETRKPKTKAMPYWFRKMIMN